MCNNQYDTTQIRCTTENEEEKTMATEKELAVREIFARRMAEQTAAKGGGVSIFCTGDSQPAENGRSVVYQSHAPLTPSEHYDMRANFGRRA